MGFDFFGQLAHMSLHRDFHYTDFSIQLDACLLDVTKSVLLMVVFIAMLLWLLLLCSYAVKFDGARRWNVLIVTILEGNLRQHEFKTRR